MELQVLQTDGHEVVAGGVLAGVEDVVPGLVPGHEVGTGAGQQLGRAVLGPVRQVDELDPVTEGGDEDGPHQSVLHRQLLKHKWRSGLLSKRVHEQNDPKAMKIINTVGSTRDPIPCESKGELVLIRLLAVDLHHAVRGALLEL